VVATGGSIATSATPDLLLKDRDENICNIRLKTHETLKTCVSNTCRKHLKTLEKAIAKYMQHPDKTLATYV
jgi:hypothetical protein